MRVTLGILVFYVVYLSVKKCKLVDVRELV